MDNFCGLAKEYKLGIDLGGTDLKYGIINGCGNIIAQGYEATARSSVDELINQIIKIWERFSETYSMKQVGIGVPGSVVDGVVNTDNLPLKNVRFEDELKRRISAPICIANDADCAAFAEQSVGVGRMVKNLIMITLGTGIGGGIIIDGRIYRGRGSAGEIGHMCIVYGGKKCNCGEHGCFEKYASASALVEDAVAAALHDKSGILYDLYIENDSNMNGLIFFEAVRRGCITANMVLSNYLGYLAVGVKNLIQIFDPDMIVFSGGITNAGDLLMEPLREKIDTNIPIRVSELKSDAGIIGAGLLQK